MADAEVVLFTNYLTGTFADTFYEGGGVNTQVPNTYDVALNGRPYMLSWQLKNQDLTHRSTRMLRWQADASNEPGEESLNYDDLWRRSTSSWHHGAGQNFLDKGTQQVTSDRYRFNTSKGVNPWTPFRLSLLNDVRVARASANTNLKIAVAGSTLYVADGSNVYYCTDVTPGTPTFTAVSSYTGASVLSLTTDGYNVYWTDGVDVWTTTTASNVGSKYIAGFAVTLLSYVKGRLMAANGAAIYNITTNAAPAALFTQANSNFSWVGFADGMNAIYCAGGSGGTYSVYRIGIRTDATSLDAPVLATPGIPTGETVGAIYGYLGYIVIGTSKGWRFCVPDTAGALKVGAATPNSDSKVTMSNAPQCFIGNDRFCYFGWTNFDASSTGLGRFDITQFGDADRQSPAYASDLMASTQGTVQAVAVFQSLVLFAVSGHGFYVQDTANLVASGTLDSGVMDYQLTDPKIALKATMTFGTAFAGTVKTFISVDETGVFQLIGTHPDTSADNTKDSFDVGQKRAVKFEMRWELDRSASVTSTGPTLTHWTLRSQPAPELTEMISVPVMLFDQTQTRGGGTQTLDPAYELSLLKALHDTRTAFPYQEAGQLYTVVLDEYEWRPQGPTTDNKSFNGYFVASMKVIV